MFKWGKMKIDLGLGFWWLKDLFTDTLFSPPPLSSPWESRKLIETQGKKQELQLQ